MAKERGKEWEEYDNAVRWMTITFVISVVVTLIFMYTAPILAFFAQSGLFVCASSMKYSPRTVILTHFSSAEKDFVQKDEAGRFEGEVQEIAEILDSLEPHSLVLLNETFQTTAYREGATGMKDILCIMDKIKCKYLFVTHMKLLFELMKNENAKQLTAKGYRLLSSENEAG